MKLHIHTRTTADREELRALLIDAADKLVGGDAQILEPKLPWDGHPILLADADGHPVLVSFEPEHSQAALLNGLAGIEQLSAALPWVNQVYDALKQRQRPPRLIVVSHETPAGTNAVLGACPNLSLFTYKILTVNGETGIWLESPVTTVPAAQAVAGPREASNPPTQRERTAAPVQAVKLPELSDEESSYFQQL